MSASRPLAARGSGAHCAPGTMSPYSKRTQALISVYSADGRSDRSFGTRGVRRVTLAAGRSQADAVAAYRGG